MRRFEWYEDKKIQGIGTDMLLGQSVELTKVPFAVHKS